MSILIIVVSSLLGIIALLLLIALFTKKGYATHSEIVIHARSQKVFDYLKHIRNQDHFNKWVMIDPDMKKEFKGTDGTVGFIYAWVGNKEGGAGEQEIKAIVEGREIDMEIRFVRPIAGTAYAKMTTEPLLNDQTKVTWSTSSQMKYPLNIMLLVIVKMLEKDMNASLMMLKSNLENESTQ